jgi:Ras-related protein Rab-4B
VLVGNKLDKDEEREVEYLEGLRWAEENGQPRLIRHKTALTLAGLLYVETSSVTGENTPTPFVLAARSILQSVDSGTLDPDSAGTGVSYGERQLRTVGSNSRLSYAFGGGTVKRRRRRESVSLSSMVGRGRRCC